MHDPMTVAFEIRSPFVMVRNHPILGNWRSPLVTIWHRDPMRGGNHNSCDWHNHNGRNLIPARWHVWHWRIQVHPIVHLKRWLFSRCCVCGKRFPWRYAPLSRTWDGIGSRWFRGEANVLHFECDRKKAQ